MRLPPLSSFTSKNLHTLTGEDAYSAPDQSTIPVPLIESLLSSASGPLTKDPYDPSVPGTRTLTAEDLALAMSQRLADCEAENPHFTTGVLHRLFGAGKCVPRSSFLLFSSFHSHVITTDYTDKGNTTAHQCCSQSSVAPSPTCGRSSWRSASSTGGSRSPRVGMG